MRTVFEMEDWKKEIVVGGYKISRDTHAKLKGLAQKNGMSLQQQARACMEKGLEIVMLEESGETLTQTLERIVEQKLAEKGRPKSGALKKG